MGQIHYDEWPPERKVTMILEGLALEGVDALAGLGPTKTLCYQIPIAPAADMDMMRRAATRAMLTAIVAAAEGDFVEDVFYVCDSEWIFTTILYIIGELKQQKRLEWTVLGDSDKIRIEMSKDRSVLIHFLDQLDRPSLIISPRLIICDFLTRDLNAENVRIIYGPYMFTGSRILSIGPQLFMPEDLHEAVVTAPPDIPLDICFPRL